MASDVHSSCLNRICFVCCAAGVRVDTWVESGTEVTPFFDSLLGKLMVHGASRPEAIAKMTNALAATKLAGIPTNLEYARAIIASPGFHAGAFRSVLLAKFLCSAQRLQT